MRADSSTAALFAWLQQAVAEAHGADSSCAGAERAGAADACAGAAGADRRGPAPAGAAAGGGASDLAPQRKAALQSEVARAISAEDDAAIVRLSENSDPMRAATPEQKARMIAILQDGWTKDRQDMAIARILTSCASKPEFDRVVDLAGGRRILEDIDHDEAKSDINQLMGGWNRIDCADDKALAAAYRGVLMPPQVDALAAARPASDGELRQTLGRGPLDARDRTNPALDGAALAFDAVSVQMGRVAHDVGADPLARNRLALANRQRQLDGKPALDYTALSVEAYRVANDPAIEAEVARRVAARAALPGVHLDDADRQVIREEVMQERLGDVARRFGVSEQGMKTLVTAKMGRVLQEGAAAVQAVAGEAAGALQARLAVVECTHGRGSAEAKRLRDALARLAPAAERWADDLATRGVTAANVFKVPPSFAESLVQVLAVLGDVLAVAVNFIPGIGQALSGAYHGVKAIVGLATGDVLAAFKSLLSAVPGFSGLLGTAAATINTGAHLAKAGIAIGEGIAGRAGSAAAGSSGVAALAAGSQLPAVLRAAGASALADGIEALASGAPAAALTRTAAHAAAVVDAIGRGQPRALADALADALRAWLPALAAHEASRALAALAAEAGSLLRSHAPVAGADTCPQAASGALAALSQLAALAPHANGLRRFEDAALAVQSRHARGWGAAAVELLQRLGLR
jgi:hypothetical protein